MVANVQNPVDHCRMQRGRQVVTGRGAIPQHRLIGRRSLPQPLDPAFDPVARATDLVSVLLIGPVRMVIQQVAEVSAGSDELLFHASNLQARGGVLAWSVHQEISGVGRV
jgi:hypothetical protein